MSFSCPLCQKICKSENALVQHTEASHGRTGVHRGALAWERSRSQVGALTTGRAVAETFYQVDWNMYDSDDGRWHCPVCHKSWPEQLHLERHLESGVHEEARYKCEDCHRTFTSLSAQRQHLQATGHSMVQERLGHTLVSDAQRQRLMLTNGPATAGYEATLKFDGAVRPNPGRGGCGWYLFDDRQRTLSHEGRRINKYPCTNNEAEYLGLIEGLKMAKQHRIKRLKVQGDSELVINQVKGEYHVNAQHLVPYYDAVKAMIARDFQVVVFEWISRNENEHADAQAKISI